MKPNNSKQLDPEYWILLCPGLVAGIILGLSLSELWVATGSGYNLWLSAAFAIAATLLSRSLTLEAVAAFKSITERKGALWKLTRVQVPMLVAGVILALSLSLFIASLSGHAQFALVAILAAQVALGLAMSIDGRFARETLIINGTLLFSICEMILRIERFGYLASFIEAL